MIRDTEGGERMMPLPLADVGEEQIIRKVGGSQDLRQHLADMGFVPGGPSRWSAP